MNRLLALALTVLVLTLTGSVLAGSEELCGTWVNMDYDDYSSSSRPGTCNAAQDSTSSIVSHFLTAMPVPCTDQCKRCLGGIDRCYLYRFFICHQQYSLLQKKTAITEQEQYKVTVKISIVSTKKAS